MENAAPELINSEPAPGASKKRFIPPPGPGRPKGLPNKITRDIRETVRQAFYAAGGKDYLVRVANKRPDVFLALVGKIIPAETKVSVLASYQGIPVQVEDRSAPPALLGAMSADIASQAVLDAIVASDTRQDDLDAIPGEAHAVITGTHDWLDP